MKARFLLAGAACLSLAWLLSGCVPGPPARLSSTPVPTSPVPVTLSPTGEPQATPDPTEEFLHRCVGWTCSLRGTVYVDAPAPGNEMQGVPVGLHQRSYCSPTAGDQQVTTGTDGAFEFQVYLHDTDSFQIRVAAEGYETVEQTFGGFDCLFCACRPLEIVLQPLR